MYLEGFHRAGGQGDGHQGLAQGLDAKIDQRSQRPVGVVVQGPAPARRAALLNLHVLVIQAPAVAEVLGLVPAAAVVGAVHADGDARYRDLQVGDSEGEVAHLHIAGEAHGAGVHAGVAAVVQGFQLQAVEAVVQQGGVQLGDHGAVDGRGAGGDLQRRGFPSQAVQLQAPGGQVVVADGGDDVHGGGHFLGVLHVLDHGQGDAKVIGIADVEGFAFHDGVVGI